MKREFSIGPIPISPAAPPLIIAEIGNNHDGSLKQAIELIDAAGRAGADAVKFQTYDPDLLVHPDHELSDFFHRYHLPRDWHETLQKEAVDRGMLFLSSPFDTGSAAFLAELGVPAFKIASSELTNLPLLHACAEYRLPMLISSGMAITKEIGVAIEACHLQDNYSVAVMHCVSQYPTNVEDAQICALQELQRLFDVPTGFSDHSLSPTLPVVAVTLGARIIEKHFTLSREMEGPDHAVALEPDEFALMARACREAWKALGEPRKVLTSELKKVRKVSLRGLYAARDLKKGHIMTADDIVALRPAASLTTDDLNRIVGMRLEKDLSNRQQLENKHFS